MLKSLRILCQVDLPSKTLRWYVGAGGPFVDLDGNVWISCTLTDDALQQIEMAINAEAFTLGLRLNGIPSSTSNEIWADYQSGQIKGSRFRLFIQKCDEHDQPYGDLKVKFTGRIDNLIFTDSVQEDYILSTIDVEITNRFTLRKLINNNVYSDTNQRVLSKKMNPGLPADKFFERMVLYLNKTIKWPKW